MVGIVGFEPTITESKSGVLPLDDIPIKPQYYIKIIKKSKLILT